MKEARQVSSYLLNGSKPAELLMSKEEFFRQIRVLMPLQWQHATWRMWDAHWQSGWYPEDIVEELLG